MSEFQEINEKSPGIYILTLLIGIGIVALAALAPMGPPQPTTMHPPLVMAGTPTPTFAPEMQR